VFQTLCKGWWLLAFCGVLDAIISVIYWIGQTSNGPVTFHAWHGTMVFLGELTLAAGACTIATGVWNAGESNSWLLVLNGLATSALGALFAFWTGPLAFRTVAVLIAIMAISIGVYELATARTLRRPRDESLFGLVGIACFGFAFAFLAFVFGWMKLEPAAPAQSLHWLGSYFGCSAICMLLLIMPLRRPKIR
jgi:uncharacterized membrane protein HdeD (DUF308 family)